MLNETITTFTTSSSRFPTAVIAQLYQYIDDFENSTTWKFSVQSKNKMPFDSPILNSSPVRKWQK